MAAAVYVRYVPMLADWMSAQPRAKDYVAGPSVSWAIALLDLGVALPGTVAVCIGYRRAAAWARAGLYALTSWFALVGAAVAGMAIAMQLRDDPAITAAQMLLMTVLGGVLVALAGALYAPALRDRMAERQHAGAGRARPVAVATASAAQPARGRAAGIAPGERATRL